MTAIAITETILLPMAMLALGWLGKGWLQSMRSRDARHGVDRKVDAELEQHWTKTTLELVDTLRVELTEAKKELSALRPMESRLAHFEEALDHIHALLSSDTDAEKAAAERRARAFMRRMRGDEAVGQERQVAQRKISIKRAVKDIEQKEGL